MHSLVQPISFFFSPPAHLCAVTYMTEISLIVTLNNQFNFNNFNCNQFVEQVTRLDRNRLGWLVVLRINVPLAIFQQYLDLEIEDNQSLKIQLARPGIEPRSSCSASQELNHSATAAPIEIGQWDVLKFELLPVLEKKLKKRILLRLINLLI